MTGSNGFVGRNLVENLENIKDGKNKTRPNLMITEIDSFDRETSFAALEEYCKNADFVFHLAGVNRPEDPSEFMQGNYGLASELLKLLKKHHNTCPVMLSSSIQASLIGRYKGSEYGKSKRAGEKLFQEYGRETGAKVLIYRFPNLFGKWCRPYYNSAVATFCHAIGNDLEYTVNDPNTEVELLYIDDLINELFNALEGREHRCDYDRQFFCYVPETEKRTLGEIVDLLNQFKDMWEISVVPRLFDGSFEKKLYSSYLSYLPENKISYPVNMNADSRGVFAELIKMQSGGQVSVIVVKPGQIRGQHWHNSKWEIFIVVSGYGLIQERRVGTDEEGMAYPVVEFEVSGEQMTRVQMLPGYTHSVMNLSSTENLIAVIWANELFDPSAPDTYYERVAKEDGLGGMY